MTDFYPLTTKDLPKLSSLVRKYVYKTCLATRKNPALVLYPLVFDLLNDLGKMRELKNKIQEKYNVDKWNGGEEVTEGFLELVRAYLEENNGTGNYLKIIEALRSNRLSSVANGLEQFILLYSLPSSTVGVGSTSIYSLSREFLLEGENASGGGTDYNKNTEPVKEALQNSVILEEIFKKLQPKDQKAFRLVSPAWLKETSSWWRRNATILIQVLRKNRKNGLLLAQFMASLEGNGTLRLSSLESLLGPKKGTIVQGTEKKQWLTLDSNNYKLKEQPFRSYELSFTKGTPFFCGETEAKFWRVCGSFVENLQIHNAFFTWMMGPTDKRLSNICERLLLEVCPNLKKLQLSTSLSWDECYLEEEVEVNGENYWNTEFVRKQDFAEKLRSLIVDVFQNENDKRKVLFLCPNLKTFKMSKIESLGPLLHPTANGEIIKLEKLQINYGYYARDHPVSLKMYTEMLSKSKFNSLEHLHLSGLTLEDLRSTPFNLYAAIAHSCVNLKTLEMELRVDQSLEWDTGMWLMDLSPFFFHNLSRLKLSFEPFYSNTSLYFDFGTLKGMRKLEELEITMKNKSCAGLLRRRGVQDWIYGGDRTTYLPTGIPLDYCFSEEDPILCKNLQKFTFNCLGLNQEDIKMFSNWFPNLAHLNAFLEPECLPLLLDNWKLLSKLEIRTEKIISLGQLRPLKQQRAHLQIFQNVVFLDDWTTKSQSLELKEHKGRLYFSYLNPVITEIEPI